MNEIKLHTRFKRLKSMLETLDNSPSYVCKGKTTLKCVNVILRKSNPFNKFSLKNIRVDMN